MADSDDNNNLSEDDLDLEIDDDSGDDMIDLANNPALKKVQEAYRKQLLRQKAEAEEELREKRAELKESKKKREAIGVELYGAQQELAKSQALLEQARDEAAQVDEESQHLEQELQEVQGQHAKLDEKRTEINKTERMVDQEITKVTKALSQLEQVADKVDSDLRIAQAQKNNASKEELRAEIEKQNQDLQLNRLHSTMKALRDQHRILSTQLEAQKDKTQQALARLNEAQQEVDNITTERRDAALQWKQSVAGLTKRNEVHNDMVNALRAEQQEVFTLDVEIKRARKDIEDQQNRNEQLEEQESRAERELNSFTRATEDLKRAIEGVKKEYGTSAKILEGTEAEVRRATQQHSALQSQLVEKRKENDKVSGKLRELEQQASEMLYDKQTSDRFAKSLLSSIKAKQREIVALEIQLAQAENQNARNLLSAQGVQSTLDFYHERADSLREDIGKRNKIITEYGKESSRNQHKSERFQVQIALLNKKIGVVLEKRVQEGLGNSEMSPAEIEVRQLQDEIAALSASNTDLQQMWLQQQSELVALSTKRQEQQEELDLINSKLAVLSQKKYRVSSEFDIVEAEVASLNKGYAALQRDLVRLDTLLSSNQGKQEGLSSRNELMEAEFLRKLKEEELDSIQRQAEIDQLEEDKTRLLNANMEAERQILQWEKKIQLAEEIKATIVDSEGHGDIASMKREIHRMELRLSQLHRQREVLIQEMERAVEKHGDINMRQKAAAKRNSKASPNTSPTKSSVQKQVRDLQVKIKKATRDIDSLGREADELSQQAEQGERDIGNLAVQLQDLDDRIRDSTREYEAKKLEYDQTIGNILYLQHLSQHVRKFDEKGRTLKRTTEEYVRSVEDQVNKLRSLHTLTEYLAENHGEVEEDIHPIKQTIAAKLEKPFITIP